MRKILALGLWIISMGASAQQHNNIWYFGYNAGINFNGGIPVSDGNSVMVAGEGCATYCDTSGQIMMYTNGVTVYNRFHTMMTNGDSLDGDLSSTHSAMIVPKPPSPIPSPTGNNLYYIFTTPAWASGNGLRYSVVDMDSSGGNGSVVLKNVPVVAPVPEKVVAIRHANNVDIWIITHLWGNNTFYSYLLTQAGLAPVPVISSVGTPHPGNGGFSQVNDAIGQIKVSPDRTKIALAVNETRFFEIFEFDPVTGILSNPVHISNPDQDAFSRAYGVEFSPNSRFLYTSNYHSPRIYQFDLISFNATDIVNSKVMVGNISGNSPYIKCGLQRGPDNKIYVAKYKQPYVGAIRYPDNPGLSCNVQDSAVYLDTAMCYFSFPTLVPDALYARDIVVYGCYLGLYTFSVTDTFGIVHFEWNFTNTATGYDSSTTLSHPVIQLPGPGLYLITLTYTLNSVFTATVQMQMNVAADTVTDLFPQICVGDSLFAGGQYQVTPGIYYDTLFNFQGCDSIIATHLTVRELPVVALPADTFFCEGGIMVLDALNPGANFQWSTGDTTQAILVSDTGLYIVKVTDSSGCSQNDTITVDVATGPVLMVSPAQAVICMDSSVILTVTGASAYNWSPGTGLSSIADSVVTANPTQSTQYNLTGTSLQGCTEDTLVMVEVREPMESFLEDTLSACPGLPRLLDPGPCPSCFFSWNTGATSSSLQADDVGLFWVKISDSVCSIMDSTEIKDCPEFMIPNVFTPNGDAYNATFHVTGEEVPGFEMTIYDRWGSKIFYNQDFNKGWDGTLQGIPCTAGTYFYHITWRGIRYPHNGETKKKSGCLMLLR